MFEHMGYKRNMLGFILREARQQAGYSLRQLAKLSGVSASQIHNVETNKYDVSVENYLRICLSLGVPPGAPLEDVLLPSFDSYSDSIEDGICPQPFDGTLWDDFQSRTLIADCLGCHAAVYQYLLTIRYPIHFCERIDFPSPAMETRFTELAQTIYQWDSLERLNEKLALNGNTLKVLQTRDILFHDEVIEKLRIFKKEGSVSLWTPFFEEESLAYLKDYKK